MVKNNKRWLKISVECDPVLVAAITDFMVGVLEAGVEVSVEDTFDSRIVNGYVDNHQEEDSSDQLGQLEVHLKLLTEIFGVAEPVISTEVVGESDWAESWKQHFHPFAIIPGLIIGPSWEPYNVNQDEQLIVMDPGMAFGTGHHPTTMMAARLIRRVLEEDSDMSVCDVGTGTGILAMAAALIGATKVVGIDNDPEAVRAAIHNVKMNDLSERISISGQQLSDVKGSFSVVVANIIHDVLLELADDFARLTRDSGYLIVSGILSGEQSTSMIDCFSERGFSCTAKEQEKEWAALLFVHNSGQIRDSDGKDSAITN